MKLLNNTIIALLSISILCTFNTDAFAQKKKKKNKIPTTAELEGTYWALFEMDGKPVKTPPNEREAYIKLVSKKNKLEGYTGCNIITGSFDLGRDYLTFEAATTERACADMTTEKYVVRALNEANRYEINGLYLLIFKGNYLLAIFEARFYDK